MSKIRIERDGPLAVLTIDSPPLNLFDDELMDELAGAVERIAASWAEHPPSSRGPHTPPPESPPAGSGADGGEAGAPPGGPPAGSGAHSEDAGAPPRGLLVRAEGRVVSGGVDVHVFDGLTPERAAQLWTRLLALVHRVEELPLPTVFAAHALCLTAAFELSLACDLLLAAESARFGLVETVVGLTPAMGGTQRLAERAGPARARELVMTGDLYDARTLERWNVVNRVLPDEGFDAAARQLAMRLAAGPTRAHAATKAIVRAGLDGGGARAADERVPELAGELFATEDLRGAVRSFLERGPGHASYRGR